MRVICAGTRTLTFPKHANALCGLLDGVHRTLGITTLVSGLAKGPDLIGAFWAKQHGIPVQGYRAKWDEEGRAAGHNRNARMAANADALVVLWTGSSPGTANMIEQAKARNLHCVIAVVPA
jgi:hypothetical protein